MTSKSMKHYFLLAIGSLIAAGVHNAYAADQSEKTGECTDLQCLICPQLSAPEEYAGGNMKSLRQIVPGRDRWLFRSEVDLTNEFGIPPNMQPEFARLMRAFASHGTHVAVAVQPTRGLMHRAQLQPGQMHGFDYVRASTNLRNFLQQMRDGGAIVPDIMPLVEQPPKDFFFRRDHHWTPIGAEATARVTADTIRQHPVYAQLPRKGYTTEQTMTLYKDGTLNLGLAAICGNHFGYQFVPGYQTVPEDNDAALLFEDQPDPEVVLVGTSNSAAREDETKQFNFDGFLKQYLSTDLINYAMPGAGQDGSLLEYLLSPNYSPDKAPKLIIWELPANYRLDGDLTYRQLIPAINGGCKAGESLLEGHVERPSLGFNDRIELLSNAGEQRKDLKGRDAVLDIRISDPNIKSFYIITYYDNGTRDKVWFRREAIVTGGQYYLELSRASEFRDANLLSVLLEPTQAIEQPFQVETRLCL
ncbi:MAG: alginate O-acetyltransferase AlgX-related protein [Pseudomonas sp.]|uniref:alginate O-acetyltransferase AlgX-related protein n=1 Tax=Ectopseudomonas mendocina TaxID=300 RepID=UPI003132D071